MRRKFGAWADTGIHVVSIMRGRGFGVVERLNKNGDSRQ